MTRSAGTRTRWLARRPPETLPPRRVRPAPPRPTPRYTAVPRWGLRQDFRRVRAAPSATEKWAEFAKPALGALATASVLAAAAQLSAYVLLLINRSRPVPGWSVNVVALGNWVTALLVALLVIVAAAALAGWLIDQRARAYAAVGTRDPHPAWRLLIATLVPVVNLVWAPVLVLELLAVQRRAHPDAAPRDRRTAAIRSWWMGWLILTGLALGSTAYGAAAGGLQHTADALLFAAVVNLLGAAFAVVTSTALTRVADGVRPAETGTGVRWLMAA